MEWQTHRYQILSANMYRIKVNLFIRNEQDEEIERYLVQPAYFSEEDSHYIISFKCLSESFFPRMIRLLNDDPSLHLTVRFEGFLGSTKCVGSPLHVNSCVNPPYRVYEKIGIS